MKGAALIAAQDALEHMQAQLGAYRAIEALTIMEKEGSEDSMGALRRGDLAMLLCCVTTSIENACAATQAGLLEG